MGSLWQFAVLELLNAFLVAAITGSVALQQAADLHPKGVGTAVGAYFAIFQVAPGIGAYALGSLAGWVGVSSAFVGSAALLILGLMLLLGTHPAAVAMRARQQLRV